VSPHRHQAFREPCSLCSELSIAVCRRCKRPLCSTHHDANASWCSVCEELWLSRRVELMAPRRQPEAALFRIARGFALAGLVPLVVFSLNTCVVLPDWTSWSIMLLPIGLIGAVAFIGSYLVSQTLNGPKRVEFRARRAFLREAARARKRRPKQLPSGASR
jgi:hypothetical protein